MPAGVRGRRRSSSLGASPSHPRGTLHSIKAFGTFERLSNYHCCIGKQCRAFAILVSEVSSRQLATVACVSLSCTCIIVRGKNPDLLCFVSIVVLCLNSMPLCDCSGVCQRTMHGGCSSKSHWQSTSAIASALHFETLRSVLLKLKMRSDTPGEARAWLSVDCSNSTLSSGMPLIQCASPICACFDDCSWTTA